MQLATTTPRLSLVQWNALCIVALGVALVVIAASLTGLFDVSLINPDTVQLISGARRLAAGDGLLTDIVYYESQLEFGRTPAPLTVWPPGFALLLAGALEVGLTPEYTAFALCLLAHVAVSALIYVSLHRLRVQAVVSLLAALVWAVHPGGWSMVLSAYTEPLFTALTFGSCCALIEAERSPGRRMRWLVAAGLLAALALVVRYSGVLWPMAAGAWFLLAALRTRSWLPLGRAIVFGLPSALAMTALFIRNYVLTQRLSGGQFDYGGAASLGGALRRAYWEASSILGSLVTAQPLVLAVVVLAVALGVVLLLRRRALERSRADMLVLGGAYVMGLGAFLTLNAVTSSAGFLDYRYWLPGLPFLLCLLAIVADQSRVGMTGAAQRPRARQMAVHLGVLGAAGLIAISASAELAVRWPIAPVHTATAAIARGLAARLPDGRTLKEALTAPQDLGRPLLAHHEHRFSLATGRAAVGLPDARFSRKVWTTEAVATIVREQQIREIVFFPPAYDRGAANNANTPFFHELSEGRIPPWLSPWYVDDAVAVYRVEAAGP